MYCKKCGAKLEEQDTFCYFCGATVEKLTDTLEKDNYYKSTSIDTDNLLNIFIGPNANKIKEEKFSLPVFFLGPLYLFYRKTPLAAFLWIIADIVSLIFIPQYLLILLIISNIIFAIKYNEFYIETAKSKIEKIKEKNSNKSSDEIINIVKRKGGVSIVSIILIIIISIVFSIGIMIVSTLLVMDSSIREVYEEIEKSPKEKKEDIYFNYTIPKEFQSGTESDFYRRYSYYGDKSYCSVKLQNSSTSVYDSLNDYLGNHVYLKGTDKVSEITEKQINGENWLYQTVESNYSTKYYYAITTSARYHLVIFEINRDEDGFCSKSHEEFIKSLKLKNNTSGQNDL